MFVYTNLCKSTRKKLNLSECLSDRISASVYINRNANVSPNETGGCKYGYDHGCEYEFDWESEWERNYEYDGINLNVS